MNFLKNSFQKKKIKKTIRWTQYPGKHVHFNYQMCFWWCEIIWVSWADHLVNYQRMLVGHPNINRTVCFGGTYPKIRTIQGRLAPGCNSKFMKRTIFKWGKMHQEIIEFLWYLFGLLFINTSFFIHCLPPSLVFLFMSLLILLFKMF